MFQSKLEIFKGVAVSAPFAPKGNVEYKTNTPGNGHDIVSFCSSASVAMTADRKFAYRKQRQRIRLYESRIAVCISGRTPFPSSSHTPPPPGAVATCCPWIA